LKLHQYLFSVANAAKERNMLWTLFVILVILWLLGMVTTYTAGGLIHILLVVALVVVLFQVIQGRRAI
jgi:hypothetical protein